MRELLASGRVAEPRGRGRHRAAPLDEVELLAPVLNPEKIIGIGLNYRAHAAEGRMEPPETRPSGQPPVVWDASLCTVLAAQVRCTVQVVWSCHAQ